jgi:hypothetical protein
MARVENTAKGDEEGGLQTVGVQHPKIGKAIVFVVNRGALRRKAMDGEVGKIAPCCGLDVSSDQLKHAPILFF